MIAKDLVRPGVPDPSWSWNAWPGTGPDATSASAGSFSPPSGRRPGRHTMTGAG